MSNAENQSVSEPAVAPSSEELQQTPSLPAPAVAVSEHVTVPIVDTPLGMMNDGIMDPALAPPMLQPVLSTISADEIALYDRQIRLWGVESQQRIRGANVLLITLKGLGSEVAKNLVLAGVGTLTLVDDGMVTEDDLGAQFLIRREHIGLNRANSVLPELQKLNPRVTILVSSLDNLLVDLSIFGAFTMVIATDMALSDQQTINDACRLQGRQFYAASTLGMNGYIFADLISHDFVISRQKGNVPTKLGPETPTRSIIAASTTKASDGKVTELVTKRELYTPIQLANSSPLAEWHLTTWRRKLNVTPILSCLRALWEFQVETGLPMPSQQRREDLAAFTSLATNKHKELQLPPETLRSDVLRMFLANLGSELSPVCAFLGGRLSQDVINVIGGKEQPIQNLLVFDGEESKASIYALSSDLFLNIQNTVPFPGMPIPSIGNGVIGDPFAGGSNIGVPLMPVGPGVPGVSVMASGSHSEMGPDAAQAGEGTSLRIKWDDHDSIEQVAIDRVYENRQLFKKLRVDQDHGREERLKGKVHKHTRGECRDFEQ